MTIVALIFSSRSELWCFRHAGSFGFIMSRPYFCLIFLPPPASCFSGNVVVVFPLDKPPDSLPTVFHWVYLFSGRRFGDSDCGSTRSAPHFKNPLKGNSTDFTHQSVVTGLVKLDLHSRGSTPPPDQSSGRKHGSQSFSCS